VRVSASSRNMPVRRVDLGHLQYQSTGERRGLSNLVRLVGPEEIAAARQSTERDLIIESDFALEATDDQTMPAPLSPAGKAHGHRRQPTALPG
jgi:hypothetical protein